MKVSTPIFVVNRLKDKDRFEYTKKMLDVFGVEYQFIEAVEGEDIPEDELSKIYSEEKAIKYIGRGMSKGEIGCCMSHIKIYRIICQQQIPHAVILEDDMSISEDILPFLENLTALSTNWNVINLSKQIISPKIKWNIKTWTIHKNYTVGLPYGAVSSTGCYVITKEFAQYCIDNIFPIYAPMDDILFNVYLSLGRFHALKDRWLVVPSRTFSSTIGRATSRKRKFNTSRVVRKDISGFLHSIQSKLWHYFAGFVVLFMLPRKAHPKPILSIRYIKTKRSRFRFLLAIYFGIRLGL